MEPIRNHQLHLSLSARGDHPAALDGRHGHRRLTSHMNAGARRANRVPGMHRVRQGKVDRID